jgi:hypothetical protein
MTLDRSSIIAREPRLKKSFLDIEGFLSFLFLMLKIAILSTFIQFTKIENFFVNHYARALKGYFREL